MILRLNLSATQYELSLLSEQRWFSVAYEQINLTHCNGEFVTVRGFSCEQLIGRSHNIVRHPDMLEVVFVRMCSYLKDFESWMEIVKKCCSIGDHYWGNAYVTYIFKQGNFTGYKFGRVKPERNQVSCASGLDARLKNHDGSLQILYLIGAILTSSFPPFIALAVTATALLFGGTTIGVVIAVLSFLAIQALRVYPWHRILKPIGSIPAGCFDSEQIARPFSGEQSPVARLRMLLISEGAKARTSLRRMGDFANQTVKLAINIRSLTKRSESVLSKQRDEADIPAIAIEVARAGEQEHGFTVAGDESGGLPPKAQESTESIQCMILPSKGIFDRAVEVTRLGSVDARSGIEQVIISTQGAPNGINGTVERIYQVNQQMVTASEQQAHVVEESIVSVSDKNADIVDSFSTVGNDLEHTVQQFNTLVARFNS